MKTLPTKADAGGRQFTVADFYEAARERLCLTLVVGGRGLAHRVDEPVFNRPGLALTGFYEHFAWNRLQLIGNAERGYLQSLDDATHHARFRGLIERQAYCFIFTNGHQPDPGEIKIAEEMGAAVLTTPLSTSPFAHRGAFVLERLGAPMTTLYATMIDVFGLGVLIEGASGLGKSETAIGLIKRGCALIADDLTCIRKEIGNNLLYGSAAESTAGYIELRGIGFLHVPSAFGATAVREEKRIQLVLTFRPFDGANDEIDRSGLVRHYKTILGVDIPNMIIPVSEGRDLVTLVEMAVLQEKLTLAGKNPTETLGSRLRARADALQSQNAQRKEQ